MGKNQGDLKHNKPQTLSQMGNEFSFRLQHKDPRQERFWNYVPVPKLHGFIETHKPIKVVFGANQSMKTTICAFEAITMYTGMIPPSLQGNWYWEERLRELTSGPNRRSRLVRIVVMDYAKHWPIVVKPKLLDPYKLGMLPEAWSDWDEASHSFTGPDGSVLDIFSADPAEKVSAGERKLRGAAPDLTWIDEINRKPVYTESAARPAGSPDSPGIITLSYCPQEGFDWTYDEFCKTAYERKGDIFVRKPEEEQHPDIYVIQVSMRDNPSITPESYASQCRRYDKHEKAYRVDGWYCARTENAFFYTEMLLKWEEEERTSPGIPVQVEEVEVDAENGIFVGDLHPLEEHLIGKNATFDERINPIWRVWEAPREGSKYIMTADLAEGNPDSDPHSVSIWRADDKDKPIQVAHLHLIEMTAGDLGQHASCMAYCYGNCLMAPEKNNTGGGQFIDRCRNYENMYLRLETENKIEKQTNKPGWFTNRVTKPAMMNNAKSMLKRMNDAIIPGVPSAEGEPTFHNHCPFQSRPSLMEFMSYEEKFDKEKETIGRIKWGAPQGIHDDCVIDACIAFKIINNEYDKLLPCKIPQAVVKPPSNEHYLGPKKKNERAAFSKWKPQKKINVLRNRR